ncbi:hypothetical protein V6255_01425 [Psychromonas arctica]|uniref:Motility protein n=1 Tax=Psychromonas arctica TaxID=168275 RepID=A0ABU9H7D0_9GAMM|nr:hypothetical protein [Psychromonas sp. L1A2]
MDIKVLASVLTEQTKINTLDTVNISLHKKNIDQTERHATQLLESIPPIPEGSKGNKIDTVI